MWLLLEQRSGYSVGPPTTEGFFVVRINHRRWHRAGLSGDRVQGAWRRTVPLKVGETCSALAAAHKRYRVECSAYITACNPFSQILDDAANAERHAALGREISQRSLASIEGIGQHPSNQWPGEASHLIFGLTLEAAKALGTRLEQNAIVWAGGDAVPQLILLR